MGKLPYALLAADVAFVALAWLLFRDEAPVFAGGFLSGAGAGLVCAVSAVGGAAWALARAMPVKHALAVVVVGMLARMTVVAVWAVIALRAGTDELGFLAGFGATYLPGQVIEAWLLFPRRGAPKSA